MAKSEPEMKRAETNGFLVTERGIEDPIFLMWESYCERKKIPDIRVRIKKKYAHISLDMIPANRRLTPEGMGIARMLLGIQSLDNARIASRKVPVAKARVVAALLAALAVAKTATPVGVRA